MARCRGPQRPELARQRLRYYPEQTVTIICGSVARFGFHHMSPGRLWTDRPGPSLRSQHWPRPGLNSTPRRRGFGSEDIAVTRVNAFLGAVIYWTELKARFPVARAPFCGRIRVADEGFVGFRCMGLAKRAVVSLRQQRSQAGARSNAVSRVRSAHTTARSHLSEGAGWRAEP
jgi:hypothetical protein